MSHRPLSAFWGEMSACEHFVQIYESDDAFIGTLADFISSGLVAGEACIVIATLAHRRELVTRLNSSGIDTTEIAVALIQNRLILLDAQETLDRFIINGWPDDRRFSALITDVLKRASENALKVRAFGEIMALMWAKGHCGATVRLEQIWTDLCNRELLPLFCAYPREGFTEDASQSIARICATHSKVLAA